MPRFYINDGARPGPRSPVADYATSGRSVVGSDVLNEAQAIIQQRKLTPTMSSATPENLARRAGATYLSSGSYNGTYNFNSGSSDGSYLPPNAFDGSASESNASSWLSARVGTTVSHWIGSDLGASLPLTGYTILANEWRFTVPPRWIVEGAQSWSGPWTTLDDRSGSDHNWTATPKYIGSIGGSYRCVRIRFLPWSPSGAENVAIAEIEIMGIPPL